LDVDFFGEGSFFIAQTRPIFSPVDIPSFLIEESKNKRNQQLDSALGPDTTTEQRTAYQMLTGLGCHSFSAVRELFGSPISVKAAAASHQGELLIIVLEYDGFLATYELVNNQEIVQFDATIEIYQRDRRLKINYETPYVRYQSSTLEVAEYTEGNAQSTIYGPDYQDPFANEICEFYDCIASNRKPKTTLQDSLEDLELFQKIIETLKISKSV
jgi:predicted dehydrogenase